MWCLVTSSGQRLPIRSLPAVVGSDQSADIVVAHESIAPHHARLTLSDDGSLFITVLEEALVEVAGWRLGKGVLVHGDELLMGTVTLRVADDSAATAGTPRHEVGERDEGAAVDGQGAEQLQLRRPLRPLEAPRPTAVASRPRTTEPLHSRQPVPRAGLLHADLSQLGWEQRALLVAGIAVVCAALVWGLATLVPLLF